MERFSVDYVTNLKEERKRGKGKNKNAGRAMVSDGADGI